VASEVLKNYPGWSLTLSPLNSTCPNLNFNFIVQDQCPAEKQIIYQNSHIMKTEHVSYNGSFKKSKPRKKIKHFFMLFGNMFFFVNLFRSCASPKILYFLLQRQVVFQFVLKFIRVWKNTKLKLCFQIFSEVTIF
jgi:hypothetical protein